MGYEVEEMEGITKIKVYGWKMDEMNMKRTMECKIWITCQDQIYGRIMGVCRKMYG